MDLKRSVKNKTLVHALRQELDAGEAEAIVSSFDIKAIYLLWMKESDVKLLAILA
jgi:predicted nucleic acid-binding protein